MTFHVKVEKPLDVVDIFMSSRYVLLIVRQAVELKEIYGKPHMVWMQLEMIN